MGASIQGRTCQGRQHACKEGNTQNKRDIYPDLPAAIVLNVRNVGKAHQIAKGVAQTWCQKGRRPEKQKRRKPTKETGIGQLDQGNNGRLDRRLACPSFLNKGFISVVQVSYGPRAKI